MAIGHQYVAVRALERDIKIRLYEAFTNQLVDMSHHHSTIIDLNNGYNRRQLSRHSAIGQYIVTAAANTTTIANSGNILTTLPGNIAGEGEEGSNRVP